VSDSAIERLVEAFRARTLPKSEWTHHAHLRVGLWHLARYEPGEALAALREGISRYNVATGVENTDSAGYHESITRFYVWQIGRFLAAADRSRPLDELAEELVRDYGDRELPLRYWSRERLMSREARLGWVEPDRAPLP
jgi:hypothetical protein